MWLQGAALLGNQVLANAPKDDLAFIRCFAAGAELASLTIEVLFRKRLKGELLERCCYSLGLITGT